MKFNSRNLSLLLFLMTFLTVSYGQDDERELRYMVGQNARDLDKLMDDRGYDHVSTSKSSNNSYSNWWNYREKKCVTARVSNGEIRSVVNVPDFDCDRDSGGSYSNSRNYNSDRDSGYNDERTSDIKGLKVEEAIETLGRRGFTKEDQFKRDGKTHRIFYNRDTRQCIDVRAMHGKVGHVENSSKCRR